MAQSRTDFRDQTASALPPGPVVSVKTGAKDRAVVVGGGIAGIYAARLLAERHSEVVLIDRAPSLGGLLQSREYAPGLIFDRGIHYVLGTGVAAVDDVVLAGIHAAPDDWLRFTESLPEGHYFNGVLNLESGCLDARTLPPAVHARGLLELLSANFDQSEFETLDERLAAHYGATYRDAIYRPVMSKLTGLDLTELAPDAHEIFHLSRLITLPSGPARKLKQVPELDARIAYGKITDGQSEIEKFYPRTGGIGRWIGLMEQDLRGAGVRVMLNTAVSHVSEQGGAVSEVELSDGSTLACAKMIWTLPPAILGTAANLTLPTARPKFRHMALVHLAYDVPPLVSDQHWIAVYDSDYLSYRVTLYSNRSGDLQAPFKITVEVLFDGEEPPPALGDRVARELRQMAIVSAKAQVRWQITETITNALPIILPGTRAVFREQRHALLERFDNLFLLGQAGEGSFGQIAALGNVYRSLVHD